MRAWWRVVLVLLAVSSSPHAVAAQARPSGSDAVETLQIRPNIYVIAGAGGNVVAHVGEEGVILVDTGSAAMADQVVAAVRKITSAPIRLIINTSADPDHIGANERLAREGYSLSATGPGQVVGILSAPRPGSRRRFRSRSGPPKRTSRESSRCT
jgi:glyoxylase-like metal-dependent hydrolase (beta-lactamase superfamily II)